MAKEIKNQDENFEEVQQALSKSGQWVEEHSTLLTGVLVAVIAVISCFILVKKFVMEPKQEEASNLNAKIARALEDADRTGLTDSIALTKVLEGDQIETMGAIDVADSYNNQQGELAALYAAICEYKLGQYQEAADHLKKFGANDVNVNVAAQMLLGDCYVEMENYDKAIKEYKAAAKSENSLIAPIALKKAGVVYLKLEDNEGANEVFMQIKNDYPQSLEARDIEKYIK